ncbi:MAG TPA: hypothetical protein VJW75_11010, partial [Candidatus Eisenbacteria bacterium]|nr:hypothetical protein [Candidatus Eisenbacteria bacterium]
MILLMLFVALVFLPGAAAAQPVDDRLFATDGQVNACVLSGNTLYIGGTFGRVGPATGSGVPVESASGNPFGTYSKVAGGGIYAAVP